MGDNFVDNVDNVDNMDRKKVFYNCRIKGC